MEEAPGTGEDGLRTSGRAEAVEVLALAAMVVFTSDVVTLIQGRTLE